ncbi:MAG: Hsp20/alpha crystallin family protein [Gilvibacter sp.]
MNSVKKNNRFVFPSIINELFADERLDVFNAGRTTIPAVNIKELEDSFVVDLAAPGMNKESFTINLEENVLTVSAQKTVENEDKVKDGRFTRREFGYSSFTRSFTLPEEVKHDDINATYVDGVLSIAIPKNTEAKVDHKRTIAIS